MHIGINALSAVYAGGVTYLFNLIEYLTRIDKSNHYYVYVTPKNKSIFNVKNDNIQFIICHYAGKSVYHRVIWEQFVFPKLLKNQRIDVLFCPANIIPLFSRCKSVVNIQNMEPFSIQLIKKRRGLSKARILALQMLTQFSIKHAQRIITLSECSKNELTKRFPSSANKIRVIYCGKNGIFNPRDKIESKCYCAKRFGIRQDFILSVSKIDPPKNFVRLILAFSNLKRKTKSVIQLVIAGPTLLKDVDFLWTRRVNLIVFIILLVGLLSSGTTGYLGLLVFFISSFILTKKKTVDSSSFSILWWWIVIGIISLFLFVLVLNILGVSLIDYIRFKHIAKMQLKSGSGIERKFYLIENLKIFKKYPILGVGFGSSMAQTLIGGFLSNTGILGTVSFLWLNWVLFYDNLRIYRQAKDAEMVALIFSLNLSFLSLFLTSLIAKGMGTISLSWYWLLLAMMAVLPRLYYSNLLKGNAHAGKR